MAYFHRCVLVLTVFAVTVPGQMKAGTHARDGMKHSSDETYSWSNREYQSIYVREQKQNSKERYSSYEEYLHLRNQYHKSGRNQNIRNIQKKTSHTSRNRPENMPKTRLRDYRVQNNDTLYGISKKFNVPVDIIVEINCLKNRNRILKGTILKIPYTGNTPKKNTSREVKPVQQPSGNENPRFKWPIKNIQSVKRDGSDGVKSIGVIINTKPGSLVLSAATGVIKKIGYMRGFGNYVVIMHQNRYATVYANLDAIFVNPGQEIETGRPIGKIQNNLTSLHFQIDHAGKPLNPLKYLPKRS